MDPLAHIHLEKQIIIFQPSYFKEYYNYRLLQNKLLNLPQLNKDEFEYFLGSITGTPEPKVVKVYLFKPIEDKELLVAT
jgi:hypothetical protein